MTKMLVCAFLMAAIVLVTEIVSVPLSSAPLEPPVVNTKNGPVRGYQSEVEGAPASFIYEGIPYAEPPVGEYRFLPPRPLAKNWTGVYNASGYRNACMQPDKVEPDNNVPETSNFSEDCLFLTVYRPATEPKEAGTKRPVMMWIHGGGFETGSIFSIAYDARYIASYGDVIVVTINYRLGAFGFLYGNTSDSEGNNGLYDQILALKWIQQNIEAFGGDRNRVTIFGESAGGMSVGSLVLSPLAHGLYQRAIMQSGAPNSYLGSDSPTNSLVKTTSFAQKVNCPIDDGAKMMKCLRAVDAKKIVEVNKGARTQGEVFIPRWGQALLPVEPLKALKTGQFNKNLDFIFGTVKEEGALFAELIFHDALDPNDKNPKIDVEQAKGLISFMFSLFHEDFGAEVAEFYVKGLNDSDKDGLRLAVERSFGDYHLTCPTVLFGKHYGLGNPQKTSRAYRMVRPAAIPVFPECHGYMGVCHGDDVLYVFGFPIRLRGIKFNEYDYHLSLDMIEAWTSFAHTGSPSKIGNKIDWTNALDKSDAKHPTVSYLSLDSEDYKTVNNFYRKACDEFWEPKFAAKFP